MNDSHLLENAPEHQEVRELLPWYVNGTIDESARQRVDAHLARCEICREELSFERRVFAKIDGETAIDYVPGPSLKRLNARLDALQNDASRPQEGRHNPATWRVLAAASIAAVTVTIGVLLIDRSVQSRAPATQPVYHTVTNATSRPRDEVIRAVFAPSVTLIELQSMLDEAHLRIVSGPSEAGVYSLASNSDTPVRESLENLRRHSTVRFAEATRLESGSGDPP
jgi:anti-sigma-K factor RskA